MNTIDSAPADKLLSKPGKHGTLHYYEIEVIPLDLGQCRYTICRWAYSLDHAYERAVETVEDEGWGDKVGFVRRVTK